MLPRRRALPFLLAALAAVLSAVAPTARAQQPLFMIDGKTTVRAVNFQFETTQTFTDDELSALLATQAPTTFDRLFKLGRKIPLLGPLVVPKPAVYPLDPLEVQRDVVRLRQFYRLNGFLSARIDYPASQLDTASNTIRVIYSINEGPPLRVRGITLVAYSPRGDTLAFPPDVQSEWRRFEAGGTSLGRGDRFSSLSYALFKGQVLDWARNRGYPFASIRADSTVFLDSLAIDLRVAVRPGPRATVEKVIVVGNTSVADRVVRREVPLRVGERFRQSQLLVGQRELFGLGLFRSVVADVPPQPADSSVAVRYTVREGRPRLLTAETGYVTDEGLLLTARWRHRNFIGGARTAEVQATWTPGLLRPPGSDAQQRLEVSATLRQPYLFNRRTSGSIGPFYRRVVDPQQQTTSNAVGAQAEGLYEFLPFRTLSLRSVAETEQTMLRYGGGLDFRRRQLSLTAAARLGRLDSYLNPRSGFDIRPTVRLATAGLTFDVPANDDGFPGYRATTTLPYLRPQVEALGYVQIAPRIDGAVRLFGGYLYPLGRARLDGRLGTEPVTGDFTRQLLADVYFNDLRYRAGGSSDVRGWALGRLGAQALELIEGEQSLDGDRTGGQYDVRGVYRPVGGQTKLAVNSELRLPFPGLSDNWRTAVFVDAGLVDATDLRSDSIDVDPVQFGATVRNRFTLERIAFDKVLRVGAGAGIRYLTPVGYLRFDLAYKVNPTLADRYTPDEYVDKFIDGEMVAIDGNGVGKVLARLFRRLQIHFGIGQTF